MLLPLLGFIALVPAQPGRRLLPAFGLVLIMLYGIGFLLVGVLVYLQVLPPAVPTPVLLGERLLEVLLAAGFLLLLLGLVRRVRTGPPHAHAGHSGPHAPAGPPGTGGGPEQGPPPWQGVPGGPRQVPGPPAQTND
ncbi:hypothetical protein GCM10027570_01710 [Streptomonospora sediminis]